MAVSKVKCIHCGKKIIPNQDYCPKCGMDIRSMWKKESDEDTSLEGLPLYCPNPRCHALYTKGEPFCNLCGNDYKKNPPIWEGEYITEPVTKNHIYCPQCGSANDNNDLFCDCGCDFRIHPRISVPPQKRTEFFCAVCNSVRVSTPDEICPECKKKEERKVVRCPECKRNPVAKFGDICNECMQKKPLKGIGEGFHIVK